MASLTVFAAQARSAGTYTSAQVTYNGGSLDCLMSLVDASWPSEPTALVVTLEVDESFDSGAIWLNAVGPYNFSPPAVDKNGNPPSAGFQAQNDGRGARLVRAKMTLNQSWSGGVHGSVS